MIDREALLTWMSIATGGFAAIRYVIPACRRGVTRTRAFGVRVNAGLERLELMHAELGDNGGRSLKDLVRRSFALAQVTDARIDLIVDQIDRPLFECSAEGANVRINEAFSQTFGWSAEDMLDQRWIRILHEQDRDHYLREWHRAIADERAFQMRSRYVTRSGIVLRVNVQVHPRFDRASGDIVRWLGRIEVLGREDAPHAN